MKNVTSIPVKMHTHDAETGELKKSETVQMGLIKMAIRPGACETCGAFHAADQTHDLQQIGYSYRFYAEHGRFPDWCDAMMHCTPDMRAVTIDVLKQYHLWREPSAERKAELKALGWEEFDIGKI